MNTLEWKLTFTLTKMNYWTFKNVPKFVFTKKIDLCVSPPPLLFKKIAKNKVFTKKKVLDFTKKFKKS